KTTPFTSTSSYKEDYKPKQSEPRPQTHPDHLKSQALPSTGKFTDGSTYAHDFGQKPLPKREVNDERPYSPNSGVGTYETTYLEDYTKKVIKENTDYLRDQPIQFDNRPQQPIQQGYINYDSTYQHDFQPKQGQRNEPGPIDDHDYVIPSEPGTYDTTYTDDYTKKQAQQSPVQQRVDHQKSTVLQSKTVMTGQSTYVQDYPPKQPENGPSYKPTSEIKTTPFTSTSSYKEDYKPKQSEPRPQTHPDHLKSQALPSTGK
ncbi:MAG: hypothetical protein EZS28_053533, partial [Streblomastix strix]